MNEKIIEELKETIKEQEMQQKIWNKRENIALKCVLVLGLLCFLSLCAELGNITKFLYIAFLSALFFWIFSVYKSAEWLYCKISNHALRAIIETLRKEKEKVK